MAEDPKKLTAAERLAQIKEEENKASGTGNNTSRPSTSDDIFDIYDINLRKKASEKGYKFINPADQFRAKQTTIGYQGKGSGFINDPESGFLYNPNKTVKPGKAGLDDFVKRHKSIIDRYNGPSGSGETAWRKDQIAGGGHKNPAMTWLVDERNKEYNDITGMPLVSDIKDKPDAKYIPGTDLFNMPGVEKGEEEVVKIPEPEKDDEVTPPPPKTEFNVRNYKTPPAEFWLQDKINMAGAWGDMQRIKKYPPWMATPGFTLPEGIFYSPERELAANSEMINQGIQGAATFTGPQGYAATAGYLHGQGAKTAADIMGRYNNLNVTEANRLSDSTNAVLNYASQQRANNANQLYDKNTVMNQQFDNSKALARQKLRQGYMDALTNRANTYNLNTINPQFAVSAGNAGKIYNIQGSNRELNNQYRGQETPEDYMKRVRGIKGLTDNDVQFLYDNYPGAKKSTASANTNTSDATYDAMLNGYNRYQNTPQVEDETEES
jgi:hypothetical protein